MATSTQPLHPENFAKLKCPPTTIICREKTLILGDVTIGADCVVHPTVQIVARNGPIVIGNNNLIEERVNIINNSTQTMTIGDDNVFEVLSYCESLKVVRIKPQLPNETSQKVGPKINPRDPFVTSWSRIQKFTVKTFIGESSNTCQPVLIDHS